MTDNMDLLKKAVAEYGQADVARKLGKSASAVNQVLKGKYAGSPHKLLSRVAEVFGNETVQCPVMGEIPLRRCAEERRKGPVATNQQRVRLYVACRNCTVS